MSREGYEVLCVASGEEALNKINNDLERIGDEAVNITERVAKIARRPAIPLPIHYDEMAEKTEAMLKDSLDALVNLDADLAYRACPADDELDEMNRVVYDRVKEAIRENPEQVGCSSIFSSSQGTRNESPTTPPILPKR